MMINPMHSLVPILNNPYIADQSDEDESYEYQVPRENVHVDH
jgi:hypothetical protein